MLLHLSGIISFLCQQSFKNKNRRVQGQEGQRSPHSPSRAEMLDLALFCGVAPCGAVVLCVPTGAMPWGWARRFLLWGEGNYL